MGECLVCTEKVPGSNPGGIHHSLLADYEDKRTFDLQYVNRFQIKQKLSGNGALAQLGERHAGSVKVAGSTPAGSTRDLKEHLRYTKLCC
jgi:hypothetical protein